MALEHVELKPLASGAPRIEVFPDTIVFHARRPDGSVEKSVAVTLAGLAEAGDPTPLLLWGMFMQQRQLAQLIEEGQKVALETDPFDPKYIARLAPVVDMLKGVMASAGVNAEHIGAMDNLLERLAGPAKALPSPQPPGAVRSIESGE
jgi:hypothetical protein